MSIVDFPGFVTDLKYHAAEGGFHYHEDHHCIDVTTGRQWWEIQLHPDYDCDGPLELHIVADLDPRTQIAFEDEVNKLHEDADWPEEGFDLLLRFHWRLPPLPNSPTCWSWRPNSPRSAAPPCRSTSGQRTPSPWSPTT